MRAGHKPFRPKTSRRNHSRGDLPGDAYGEGVKGAIQKVYERVARETAIATSYHTVYLDTLFKRSTPTLLSLTLVIVCSRLNDSP